jgi:hypothetical protein
LKKENDIYLKNLYSSHEEVKLELEGELNNKKNKILCLNNDILNFQNEINVLKSEEIIMKNLNKNITEKLEFEYIENDTHIKNKQLRNIILKLRNKQLYN